MIPRHPRPPRSAPSSLLAAVLLAALLAGCAALAPAPPAAAVPGPSRPALLVVIVIDGLPQRQLAGLRDQFGPDGFNRFLDRGTWYAQARYGHAYTVTAPGHATLLTGAYPHRTGIIGNEWRDPATGRMAYCTGDPDHAYLGHRTAGLVGTSPRNLRAESLGDVLRRADARAKVIAVSGKDRGAILPAGRDGTAYMFMAQTGRFASSTYYMAAHPSWVEAFNDAKPADRHFRAIWKPLLPAMAYARSVPDDQPWYLKGGRLPMVLGEGHEAPGPLFYDALQRSPFLDALTLDFARAAIAGEALGADDAPDLLVVSLSSHDLVNHAWTAESRLSHDHLLQLDNLLAAFFRDLDRRVGAGRYALALSSDHGFMPAPEQARPLGRDAGRAHPARTLAAVETALGQRFGDGKWVLGWSGGGVLLDRNLAASRGLVLDDLAREARRVLLGEPGIAAAWTARELADPEVPDAPLVAAVRRSFHPDLSADVQVVLKPGWMLSSRTTQATHGSPWDDDTHVPILLYGPAWFRPGRVDARVEVVDLAPTLAALLRIGAPAAAEGRPLPPPP